MIRDIDKLAAGPDVPNIAEQAALRELEQAYLNGYDDGAKVHPLPTLFSVHDPARHMQLLGTATLRKVGRE